MVALLLRKLGFHEPLQHDLRFLPCFLPLCTCFSLHYATFRPVIPSICCHVLPRSNILFNKTQSFLPVAQYFSISWDKSSWHFFWGSISRVWVLPVRTAHCSVHDIINWFTSRNATIKDFNFSVTGQAAKLAEVVAIPINEICPRKVCQFPVSIECH